MTNEEMLGLIMAAKGPPPEFLCAGTNPVEMGQNGEVAFAVTGGRTPMEWAISGTDFTLASPGATGRDNLVRTGPDACGSGTVSITDDDALEVSCVIRCTTGYWWRRESDTWGACGGDQENRVLYFNPGRRLYYKISASGTGSGIWHTMLEGDIDMGAYIEGSKIPCWAAIDDWMCE